MYLKFFFKDNELFWRSSNIFQLNKKISSWTCYFASANEEVPIDMKDEQVLKGLSNEI
jgi:hypothetical protein